MSKQALEAVIGRAVTDGAFRSALFARPDVALAGYDLTAGEMASLKAIDFETMDSFAGVLDERVSKATALGLLSALSGQASAQTAAADQAAQQAASLSAEQLSHMSAQQLAALSAEQLSHMSTQQMAALTAEQASSLSAQQLAQLSAQQLAVVLSKLPGTLV